MDRGTVSTLGNPRRPHIDCRYRRRRTVVGSSGRGPSAVRMTPAALERNYAERSIAGST
ncbi:hypothetical protein ACFFRL_07765 [Agromyces hippuratus]|uniref:hypothetical protein n=1 Tax=Agromyces hippuratus TaxID=286438 RepID=UPI0035F0BA6F